jgi:hypothetical protein
MKNKLLLTTAIAGSLVFAGSAMSQTSITGSLDIAYKSQSYDLNAGAASKRGFGREAQVNVQNKGKLANGMEYTAGFALEFDGASRTSSSGQNTMAAINEPGSISNENVYVDVELLKGTTVTVGVDHIQNITRTVPQVLEVLDHVAAGLGMSAVNTVGAQTKESMGIGIVQVIPFGTGLTASFNYAPNSADFGLSDQAADATQNHRNSSYEMGVTGVDVMGIKGLGLWYFQNKEEASREGGTDLIDKTGKSYGVSYSGAGYTAGYSEHKHNRASMSSTADVEAVAKTYAVTYAVNKDITLGLTRMVNNADTQPQSERINAIQLGYNLGPVALVVSGSDISGIAYANGADAKELGVRLSTRF